jgi:hypothetical protein
MNTLTIAVTLATCAIAAEVPKYLGMVESKDVPEDCKFISEEEYKKVTKRGSDENHAAMAKCTKNCTGIDIPAKDATAEEKKAAQQAALAAGLKIMAEVADKCEGKDKEEECVLNAMKKDKMCMLSCSVCTNYDSASALVLGAAAVATAMLLI